MFKLEVVNELMLKATCTDGNGELFTKAGAWVAGTPNSGYKFSKVLLGPQGNPLAAIAGQVMRRVTGENLPLMKVTPQGYSETYYANLAQHVTVINLPANMTIAIESENILAFTNCKYGTKLMGSGVVSQKGLFTSTLTGMGPDSAVAILTDGNPLVLDTPCKIDPDAHIAHIGSDPGFAFDIGFRNLLGSRGASGETYQFDFKQPGGKVIIQPSERKSGLDIGIDGSNTGSQPDLQQNQTMGQGMGNVSDVAGQVGNMLGGLFGGNR